MCGIAGLLHVDDDDLRRGASPPARLQRSLRALAHRGPDGHHIVVDDGLAILHARLALVDLNAPPQPFVGGGYLTAINGEIYNHLELRRRYQAAGHVFRSHCDSEVVLAGLIVDGPASLERLDGEFALVVAHPATRWALLRRDPLGVKPLVYARLRRGLAFASEVKGLLPLLPTPPAVDIVRLQSQFLCPAFAGEDIALHGVETVPPGATVRCVDGVVDVVAGPPIRTPLRPTARGDAPNRTAAPQGALQRALQRAVRQRQALDAPLGAFLSGGLDSSGIVALSDPSRALPCFTLDFRDPDTQHIPHLDDGSIVISDDRGVAVEVAAACGRPHHLVAAHHAAWWRALRGVFAHQDRLVAWEQEASQWLLAEAAARQVKAVLVGDAADETHFGYAFALGAVDVADANPPPGTSLVLDVVQTLLRRFGAERRAPLLRDGRALARAYLEQLAAPVLASGAVCERGPGGGQRDWRARRLLRLEAATQVILHRWLSRLLHNGDLHTMAHGLEARVPFADAGVVRMANEVHVDDAWRPHATPPEKAVLRAALSGVVPAAVLRREKSALPRREGLAAAYWQAVRGGLAHPGLRDAFAEVFQVDALTAVVDAAPDDDEHRALAFHLLATQAFLHQHWPSVPAPTLPGAEER